MITTYLYLWLIQHESLEHLWLAEAFHSPFFLCRIWRNVSAWFSIFTPYWIICHHHPSTSEELNMHHACWETGCGEEVKGLHGGRFP
jgi:hypothetical protein